MISYEEQIELTERSLKKLRNQGQEWVTHDEIAFQYMLDHPDYERKQRVINYLRSMFRKDESGEPTKVSYKYRHQASIGVLALKDNGDVEYRLSTEDNNGNPKGREYRLAPEISELAEPIPKAA